MVLGGILVLNGCTGDAADRLVPVSGRITSNGQPAPSGTVVFYPDPDRGNASRQEARGTIDAQGVYRLKTGKDKGAPPGWYQVAVFALKPPRPEQTMSPPEWWASQRYSDPRTSGLAVEVTPAAAPNAYDFDLLP